MKVEEKIKRKDGKMACFTFEKPKNSVWYWNLPGGKSLPLPDVDLDKAKSVKECLDLISKIRIGKKQKVRNRG